MSSTGEKQNSSAPPVGPATNPRPRTPFSLPAQTRFFARLLTALSVVGSLALGSCLKSSELEGLEQENKVQDQRLKALEDGIGASLDRQEKTIAELTRSIRAFQGQVRLMNERTDQFGNEQGALTRTLEKDTAERRRLAKEVSDTVAKMERMQLEAESEMDKLRLKIADLEKLLRSPLSGMEANTDADRDYRKAFATMIRGEMDLAVDYFDAFVKAYPDEHRVPDAMFHKGQSFYMIRRYDQALAALFDMVDRYHQHELALPARWLMARALEETGDLKLARDIYNQLISGQTKYAQEATRRLSFINRLFPENVK
ncbi:MAG: tetratricopeptide repeat protein [Deltaproteobacteria bacterium]|nr:tetratricopeptide repeat protein [Deltaproteobacteria bacterium]